MIQTCSPPLHILTYWHWRSMIQTGGPPLALWHTDTDGLWYRRAVHRWLTDILTVTLYDTDGQSTVACTDILTLTVYDTDGRSTVACTGILTLTVYDTDVQSTVGSLTYWHWRSMIQTGSPPLPHWHWRSMIQTGGPPLPALTYWHWRSMIQTGSPPLPHWHTDTDGLWYRRAVHRCLHWYTDTDGLWYRRAVHRWLTDRLTLTVYDTDGQSTVASLTYWQWRSMIQTGGPPLAHWYTDTDGLWYRRAVHRCLHWHWRSMIQTGSPPLPHWQTDTDSLWYRRAVHRWLTDILTVTLYDTDGRSTVASLTE